MTEIEEAATLLRSGGYSCVVKKGDVTHTFTRRGVADLYTFYQETPELLVGACIADKVVGKASAAIMAIGGVKEVYADVISTEALSLLRQKGIAVSYDKETPYIENRDKTGLCPMETACKQQHTPQEIYNSVKAFIAKLKQPKNAATALIACMVGISPLQSHAQHDNTRPIPGDTIKEIVVTGTRNATDTRNLPTTVSVIDRQTIEQSMQPSLLPILTTQVPGLFTTSRGIMGYGVSGGAAGSISLRGLSGSSGQLMVLIDGHPQYMGLMGHPIADAYQTMLTEKVEVARGPASMLYGSNAMGGVINIVTRRMQEEGVKTHIHAGYGSFNTLETEATNRVRKGGFTSVASVSYNRTDGHRPDMNFEQYGGYVKLGYEFSPYWKARADANVTHFNASQPGSTTTPLADADQRITRGMTSVSVENNYDWTSGAISLFYNWGDHRINDGYTPNPNDTNNPKEYRFISHDDMMGVSVYQSAQLFTGNRLTVGIDYFHFGGSALNRYVSGDRTGQDEPIVEIAQDEIAGYVDFRQDITRWVTVDAGVRIDHHSQTGTEWIPQAGISLHLPYDLEMKALASKGFRNPTIREMYMFPPQNPDLQPESMWNYEIALSQQLLGGRLSYGVNIFYIDGKNLIMTLPNPNGSGMLNQNSGKIDNTGVEVEGNFRIDNRWAVNANYSFLHMENPVLAAPEHKLYAGCNFTHERWSVSTGLQYVAGLYTAVKTNGTGEETKENFLLWNLQGAFRATKWLEIWVRGENLLAQQYEIIAGYPMPRATFMGGVNINF